MKTPLLRHLWLKLLGRAPAPQPLVVSSARANSDKLNGLGGALKALNEEFVVLNAKLVELRDALKTLRDALKTLEAAKARRQSQDNEGRVLLTTNRVDNTLN
jgi:hypothetical protein